MWALFSLSPVFIFTPPSEYGTSRINSFPLATAQGLECCVVTDGAKLQNNGHWLQSLT